MVSFEDAGVAETSERQRGSPGGEPWPLGAKEEENS